MDNSEEKEDGQVLERYKQLAGLLKDGHMVNRDKEHRAREYVKNRKKLIELAIKQNCIRDDSKYGKLIIQTNEV
ncbi:MAG: hypothetical protein A3G59_01910 [Candidatus Taylorbacteria bacterium RIFCSPLOWO2_12_FULL_47_20]|uniref:Uncharacterized protein n=2 Tax=Candidatus Tayloriibacteriota TaxID=1817919 RepID=A0A1G2P4S4_9BACT|nr:MAG: hypothetical protein A3H68_00840 [Candidatus Taylorbacteria bacterium RIFCSPLOWO2_02_FULL_46_40]OHA43340.1 MAG: hypothetical protein A3G59_01910 [Candidatus Taylorbacteria bacterium RIFCSPLOWO2_12_FULL_47_20]